VSAVGVSCMCQLQPIEGPATGPFLSPTSGPFLSPTSGPSHMCSRRAYFGRLRRHPKNLRELSSADTLLIHRRLMIIS
jgi:hypothetical protein